MSYRSFKFANHSGRRQTILASQRKCYYYPWRTSYTLHGSVTTTPGVHRTHCTEVLLLPLAYIVHTAQKCYYYPWRTSYTLHGSVTTTPGVHRTHCTEVLLLPLAYILHTAKSFVLRPTCRLGRRVSGNQTAEMRPRPHFKERFQEMPIFTRPTSDDGSTTT